MLPETFVKRLDSGRLRNLLALFFAALALPTVVLIWQAYSQLKWEAFHQYRVAAEELATRINARLNESIVAADSKSFADYSFLKVTGDPSANFVERSPLSVFPVRDAIPGVLGYFQVDTGGSFSTPLLPPDGAETSRLGINDQEYRARREAARTIQAILADNRLVRERPEMRAGRDGMATPAPLPSSTGAGQPEADRAVVAVAEDEDVLPEPTAVSAERQETASEAYSQQVFDRLNLQQELRKRADKDEAAGAKADVPSEDAVRTRQRPEAIGKVSALRFDEGLQEKSQALERKESARPSRSQGLSAPPERAKRREQIALPDAVSAGTSGVITGEGLRDLRISTFESEVDPFEFSLLDSGHLVLFRKVWREGERYIQGLLIEQSTFMDAVIGTPYLETSLSGMSSLLVAYQDDVLKHFAGSIRAGYPGGNGALDGALLYRARLATPLDSLQLIFTITRLPAAPGASVLAWVTLVLGLVFIGGFFTLYRLGQSQIRLARQQQDFVSAVSHELKTPLTSIRMYGEMLKEGWADEGKRQTYYEYIHDESERLARLVSNVLQLARLTRSEPQFDLKVVQVGELMRNTHAKIASQVQRAGFELRFKSEDGAGHAKIEVDEDCFSQIVINLVDNAIKFSRDAERKEIEIGSRLSGDGRVVFSVRDYGPGIPKDQMKKIFGLFYRSESELTRETVGTGIGLAIVHQLTMAMNGKVDLVNREPGAEFLISFPAAG